MNHVQQSIRILQKLATKELYNLGFSGGKDSVVILDLARKSGVSFQAIYANTTIDPPGTLSFIRKNYPEVKILTPDKNFYQLVAEKGLPSRQRRWCCERLKERYGIGKRSIEGMRREESPKRAGYEPEICDIRSWMKGAKHILPIVMWTEKQVWEYIKENNLPYMKYYKEPYNFSRHGCVGCPLCSKAQMRKEFQAFPGRVNAFLKALRKHIELKPKNYIATHFSDEYEALYFYVVEMSYTDFLQLKNGLFKPDFKDMIKNYLEL